MATPRAMAEECTGLWQYLLDTDPAHPKDIAGDSHAGYALFSFWGDASKRFVMKGAFARTRFFSIETNHTRWGFSGESLFDAGIVPDAGSVNPFHAGVALDAPVRDFEVAVVPQGAPGGDASNVLHIGNDRMQQSLLLRYYSPNTGVVLTAASMPRVFAYDVETGAPTTCPRPAPVILTLDLPQALIVGIPRKPAFDFMDVKVPWGPNSAIPAYLGAATRMRTDDVALIRFKAPVSVDTRSGTGAFDDSAADVRYWSFCAANLVKEITLGCVPDWRGKADRDGFVTIAVGRGERVKRAAEARGYAFLEDTRDSSQKVMQFVYRNILPGAAFTDRVYQGDYRPEGRLCERDDFVAGRCD